jgi:hypothetical protein
MEKLKHCIDEWSYRIVGPTTVHLKFEFYLLVSLTLLTVSSLQGLYKENFGRAGDYMFVFVVAACLSRHLIFRLLCTWDPSTHCTPTLTGLISHFCTAHLTGGQVYDRPSASVLSRLVGTVVPNEQKSMAWMSLLPTSFVYAWHLLVVGIWLPLKNRRIARDRSLSHGSRHRNVRYSSSMPASLKVGLKNGAHAARSKKLLAYIYTGLAHGPSLQFVLPILALALIGSGLGLYHSRFFNIRSSLADHIEYNLLAMSTRSHSSLTMPMENDHPYGAYRRPTRQSWWNIFLEISALGNVLPLLFFCRVLLPLPDLMAGGNVVKDVRQDSRSGATGTTSTGGAASTSGSTRTSSKVARMAKDSLSMIHLNPQDTPWTERVRPIATSNRLRLTCQAASVRLIENIFLCAILPRTHYTCRATGHCPTGIPAWEMNKILFPVGVSSPYREDGLSLFGYMEWDVPSALLTGVCVVSVSAVLLSAHTLVTNRSYLSILGYLAGEWERTVAVETEQSATVPNAWDSRKRYKKGDLVAFALPGQLKPSFYRATVDNPDGKPMDLKPLHKLLQTELGHPSTSLTTARLATMQLWVVLSLTFGWLFSTVFGYSTYGALVRLIASLLALQSLVTVSSMDYGELARINDEAMASAST